MSKGKIDVLFSIQSYGLDPKLTMRALLRKEGSTARGSQIQGTLLVKPKHEIKKYETFQLIAAKYNKLDALDEAIADSKGNVKICLEGLPAEFIHSKRKSDGTEYDVIIVNFGTDKVPHLRSFYLSDMQSELLNSSFKSKYQFDVQEDPNADEQEEDEDSEE